MKTDAAVQALMRKVKVLHDPTQMHKPGEPRTESARVTLTLGNGALHEVFVGHVPGYPSHPLSRAEVEQKALELMIPRLGEKRARAVVEYVANLESMKQAGELPQMIAV